MRNKRILEIIVGKACVKVQWNREFQVYICKLYIGGKHHEPADYETNDATDAMNTARHMAAQNATKEN